MLSILAVAGSQTRGDSGFVPPELHVPEGFVVEVVAAPPLVGYPMMGCLDELGRLFIAESHGQNLDKQGLRQAKHRFIRMLEDTDGDGRFDKSTIFANELVMPEGAVCYRGSLYVLSSPYLYLWRFEDTDGDGVADVREKLVGEREFKQVRTIGKADECQRLYNWTRRNGWPKRGIVQRVTDMSRNTLV
jgi:glucose/arabinose dehydrogenase